jgi:hypothetical protein
MRITHIAYFPQTCEKAGDPAKKAGNPAKKIALNPPRHKKDLILAQVGWREGTCFS